MGLNYYDLSYDELDNLGFMDIDKSSFLFDFILLIDIHNEPIWCNSSSIKEVDKWCIENLQGFFRLTYSEVSFEYKEDAMAFKLMWL